MSGRGNGRSANGHAILFLQPTDDVSRTYSEYSDVNGAFYSMCEMFEETYKRKMKVETVAYEVDDVISYFTSFSEILLLVYDEDLGHYRPRDSEWIAEQLEEYGKMDPSEKKSGNTFDSSDPAESGDAEFEENWE